MISSFNNNDDDDRKIEYESREERLDIDNHTKGGEESINLADYTINGEQCEGLVFRILESPVTEDQVRCEVCAKTFQGKEVLKMHMDEMHFNACPICEKSFYRSVDKVSIQNKRISQNVKENSIIFRSLQPLCPLLVRRRKHLYIYNFLGGDVNFWGSVDETQLI